MQQFPGLYFAPSPLHGRGVFCASRIHKGDVIEVAPVLRLKGLTHQELDGTILHDYYFVWGRNMKSTVIVLGYGSLYNHSSQPNATFETDLDQRCVIFKAIRDIPAEDEITINFHEGKPEEKVWFEVRE